MNILTLLNEDDLIQQLMTEQEKASDSSDHDSDIKMNWIQVKKWSDIIFLLQSVVSETELWIWLQSSLFHLKWLNYYHNFVLSNQLAGDIKHDDDLKTIIHAAAVSHQETMHKYTYLNSDTSDWNFTDWMIQLFVQII